MNTNLQIGIIGLGYVGLPLACLFAGKYDVVGYDLNPHRVADINAGIDSNDDLGDNKVAEAVANGLRCTSDIEDLRRCSVYIVAVPTPVDDKHRPDLSILRRATATVGKVLSEGDIVIYESTVYPGTTEEVCAPLLEEVSGLVLDKDFSVGFSPERINPGDRLHTVGNIVKITSGSNPEAAEIIDNLYASVLEKGTHRAPSIKVAEASKILENTQRDVNIAFMNEMLMVFDAMGIDIYDVLSAASTKWNFLNFRPGLVGGHCIGVDPYYLIDKARSVGQYPRLTSESRRVNESMSRYFVEQLVLRMSQGGIVVKNASVLILGFTFKENCRDIRNTKIADIYRTLLDFTDNVDIYDPYIDPSEVMKEYGIPATDRLGALSVGSYDAVICCVPHDSFRELDISSLCRPGAVIYDIKGAFGAQTNKQTNKQTNQYI